MTLQEYIVDVIYRSAYYTNKLACMLKTGGDASKHTAYLLDLATMYIDYLHFHTSNDSAFDADELRKVCTHLDLILKSNYASVENSYFSVDTSGNPKRFYGLTTDPSPTVNDALIDGLTADTVNSYTDVFGFTISGSPNKYCLIAIPYTGVNYQNELWTDGSLIGYYFRRISTLYGYVYNGETYTLDIYISYWSYAQDRSFKLVT